MFSCVFVEIFQWIASELQGQQLQVCNILGNIVKHCKAKELLSRLENLWCLNKKWPLAARAPILYICLNFIYPSLYLSQLYICLYICATFIHICLYICL